MRTLEENIKGAIQLLEEVKKSKERKMEFRGKKLEAIAIDAMMILAQTIDYCHENNLNEYSTNYPGQLIDDLKQALGFYYNIKDNIQFSNSLKYAIDEYNRERYGV